MVQIRWTLLAIKDLQSIYEFVARDSQKYAQIEVIKIKLRTKILKNNPFVGKEVKERTDPRIRELIEGNFRIIYKIIDKTTVDILTIHHSARGLTKREIE